MIIWVLWLSALAWTTSKCEPPVNSYLPPGNGQSDRPSPQYGPPGFNNGGSESSSFQGSSSHNQNGFSSSRQSGRQSSLDTQYGVPSSQNFGQGSAGSQNGFNSQTPRGHYRGQGNQSPINGGNGSNGRSTLQSTYGPPGGRQNPNGVATRSGSNGFAQAEAGFGQRPETSYGPPPVGGIQTSSNGFGGQSSSLRSKAQRVPDSTYGTPNTGGFNDRNSGSSSPLSSYDTPGVGSGSGGRGSGQEYSSHGQDVDGGESDEPAKYEFSYEVDDAQTGTKFGHSEQRDGDLAQGEYNVVLPDGRKQVVEYEAGLQGYKPQIRYEGSQDGNQEYSQGGQNGFPGSNNGAGTFSQYQDQTNDLNQGSQGYQSAQLRSQQNAGYPRSGPNSNGRNGNGHNGFPEQNRSNLQTESLGYPSGGPGGHGNGVQNRNGNNGYSSGRPQNSNGFSNGAHRGNGNGGSFSNGGRQNGNNGHGNNSDGTEGYPSGGPNGRRGSGY